MTTQLQRFSQHFLVMMVLLSTSLFTPKLLANTNLGFHEVASTVMINTLQKQSKNSFLRKLYAQLFFVPVWIDEESLSTFSTDLFTQIKSDKTLSKTSKLYMDTIGLEARAKSIYIPEGTLYQKVNLEFKISQLYKGYADYLLYGSINWGAFSARLYNLKAKSINGAWETHRPAYSPISLIENAAMGGSLSEAFLQAQPKEYRFKELQAKLLNYLEIEANGGWGNTALKGSLRLGKAYNAVPQLRTKLYLMGDYVSCGKKEGKIYDTCLKKAIVSFQKRHGLIAKGVIGKNTLTALNRPLSTRIQQIRLNLDRIKWLDERNNKRHIMINIPSFTLSFEENKALRQEMKVIIGKRKNPTPIFSNTVKTIVLNPHWNIPKSIIQKEMIPKLLGNSNAMAQKGIEIYSGWNAGAKKIKASSVDWSKYRYSKSVPFRFAQVPGTRNALGKVKFLFPNKYAVYMHDTPNKRLFNRNVRAFSHGCIRLHKPRELLKTFSTFNNNVSYSSAQKRLKGVKKAYLNLPNSVPVDVTYLTAYVDYKGVLQFRNDIYGYDKMQLQSYRKW